MKRMILSSTHGKIRKRHHGNCRSHMIRRQEEGNDFFFFARSFLLDDALFWKSKRTSNAGSPSCRATRRKLKNKLNNEIDLADLEASEVGGAWEASDIQLKSHANFWGYASGNRDVRGGEVWFENSWFQIESHGFNGDTQIPWMLMRSILSRLTKENDHRVHVMNVSNTRELIFIETAIQ